MKFFSIVFLFIGVLVSITEAQLEKYASELPACGLQCTLTAVQQSTCSLTNSTCICTNVELATAAAYCVATTCNVTDSLKVAKINELSCGIPVKNYQTLLKTIAYVFCITAEVAVLVRIWVKLQIAQSFNADDWVIVLAGAVNIPYLVLAIIIYDMGFGANLWDIPLENVNTIFKYYLIDEALYLAILAITKISLLIFLQRIFPSRQFKIAVWVLGSIITAFGVIVVILTITQCSPISYAWTKWDGVSVGTCRDINAQTFASAGVNIVQDFAILALPMPELYKLQCSTRKKFQLFLMFSVGLFVSITSIIRLQGLVKFSETTNPTLDYTPAIYCLVNATPSGSGIWQKRSFKIEKKLRSETHDFHELDERTIAGDSASNTSRTNAGTPDSQRQIVNGNSKGGGEVWVMSDSRDPQPNFSAEPRKSRE